MDLESRRELYNGFGDAMARGIEYVGTPVLFALIGFFLDKRLGLTPVLTIALVLFAVAGTVVRAYYGYAAAMSAHEARGPWARQRPPAGHMVGAQAHVSQVHVSEPHMSESLAPEDQKADDSLEDRMRPTW